MDRGHCSLFISHLKDAAAPAITNSMQYNFHARQRARKSPSQSFGGNSGNNSRGRGNTGAFIPVERFINKSVKLQDVEVYKPQHTFDQFGFDARVMNNLKARNYVLPTPIQDQSMEAIIQGKDLIGLANTGTGKTAAFLLPIIQAKMQGKFGKALVIVPTRELATQIMDEFQLFAANLNMHATVCVGGANISRQIMSLRRNPDVIIGTPGRLKDLTNQHKLPLAQCTTLVLDEVDRMLDMGFIHDIRFLVEKLPSQRQSLCFSATMTKDIEVLAHTFLQNPITVSVRTRSTADNVDQDVVYVGKDDKTEKLIELLNQPHFTKVLVFGGTKWGVEKLALHLHKSGLKVATIHGNKSQPQRQRALNDFKADKVQALIATDVAARGLDIPSVSHVINFDIPHTYEEYVHRIGRTGRANQTGSALTFVPPGLAPRPR
jgi:ATP-dependent RNA helicase RhlE